MNTPSDQSNRYAAPQAEVDDVKDDAEAGELAGRGERLGAAMIDGLVVLIVMYVPFFSVWGTAGFKEMMEAAAAKASNPIEAQLTTWGFFLRGASGVAIVIGLLLIIALNIYFVRKNSQSIGKKLVGIKVVRSDGSHAPLGRIFWLRNFPYYLIYNIPFIGKLFSLVDPLFIFGEQRRCIHDYIADTIVVKA